MPGGWGREGGGVRAECGSGVTGILFLCAGVRVEWRRPPAAWSLCGSHPAPACTCTHPPLPARPAASAGHEHCDRAPRGHDGRTAAVGRVSAARAGAAGRGLRAEPPVCPSPECEIECPERLCAALSGLQRAGLEGRCLRVSAREASEEELSLVHRSDPAWDRGLRGRLVLLSSQPAALLSGARGGCVHAPAHLSR